MSMVEHQQPVETFAPCASDLPLHEGFAMGSRDGVRITRRPAAATTASAALANFASLSQIRKRPVVPIESRPQTRFLACGVARPSQADPAPRT